MIKNGTNNNLIRNSRKKILVTNKIETNGRREHNTTFSPPFL